MCSQLSEWLSAHSVAVQAASAALNVVLTTFLVVITAIYVITTGRILAESRRSREATEKQASAAQEQLAMLKRDYEERLGLGPQRVREAAMSVKLLLAYWMEQAARVAVSTDPGPDPADLSNTALTDAVDFARAISIETANLVLQILSVLRNAKSEFERVQKAPILFNRRRQIWGPGPLPYLQQADTLVNQLLGSIPQR